MDWLQNPLDIAELSSSCPCQGAKCLGRCSAYGVSSFINSYKWVLPNLRYGKIFKRT